MPPTAINTDENLAILSCSLLSIGFLAKEPIVSCEIASDPICKMESIVDMDIENKPAMMKPLIPSGSKFEIRLGKA